MVYWGCVLYPTTSPAASHNPSPFQEALRRGQLLLPRCLACGHVFYPPKAHCPRCGSSALEWTRCSGRGRIYSYVINHRPLGATPGEAWDVMAVVELDEGPRILATVVGLDPDPAQVRVDMMVEVAFPGADGPATTLSFRSA
ncbi:MAG: Zn-ribbon domain-containing OB-fold protein [Chloroflexi bacterium]|nr:Zn-ribbon domain-containing OB-fold protein [Chloroflexota bacterium]